MHQQIKDPLLVIILQALQQAVRHQHLVLQRIQVRIYFTSFI